MDILFLSIDCYYGYGILPDYNSVKTAVFHAFIMPVCDLKSYCYEEIGAILRHSLLRCHYMKHAVPVIRQPVFCQRHVIDFRHVFSYIRHRMEVLAMH